MGKAEFLQLAHKYNPEKDCCTNWYSSIKLDGIRCFWDSGISRGVPAREVPWANVEKDDRLLAQPMATGLWSRYGKVIHAPEWWLASLPDIPLDGELWAGVGSFQRVTSICKRLSPTPEWEDVQYRVFTTPPLDVVLSTREINNTNYRKKIDYTHLDWARERGAKILKRMRFSDAYAYLQKNLVVDEVCHLHEQEEVKPGDWLDRRLDEVVDQGHEGLMLQHPDAMWVPERSHMLLKMKPFNDDEAVVVSYTWGKRTDKGSKLLGLMGNLVCRYGSKTFELSGFTDEERELIPGPGADPDEGSQRPGEPVSKNWRSYHFPIGSKVTFRYRELTDDQIPKEARYHRKHVDV